MALEKNDNILESLLKDLPQELQQFKDSFKQHLRMRIQAQLNAFDFVAWDDFSALKTLVNQLSDELSAAEAKLAVLENKLGSKSTQEPKKKPAQKKKDPSN